MFLSDNILNVLPRCLTYFHLILVWLRVCVDWN